MRRAVKRGYKLEELLRGVFYSRWCLCCEEVCLCGLKETI